MPTLTPIQILIASLFLCFLCISACDVSPISIASKSNSEAYAGKYIGSRNGITEEISISEDWRFNQKILRDGKVIASHSGTFRVQRGGKELVSSEVIFVEELLKADPKRNIPLLKDFIFYWSDYPGAKKSYLFTDPEGSGYHLKKE